MSREIKTSICVTREESEGDEIDFTVDIVADYTEATPDVHYLPNGDPGYPGNDEEVEITESSIKGVETELTADEREQAVAAVIEKANR